MGREICSDTKTCDINMINDIVVAQSEEIKNNLGDKILFSDTDLLTTVCYSEYLFNEFLMSIESFFIKKPLILSYYLSERSYILIKMIFLGYFYYIINNK